MEYFKDIDKQLEEMKEIKTKISNYDIQFKKNRKNLISFKKNAIRVNVPKIQKLSKSTNKFLKQINKETKKQRKERLYLKRIPKKYEIYIKSKFWLNRKNKYYQKYGKKCVICNSTNFINLHHSVYGNYGNEKDEHLFAFCRNCHNEFHMNNKMKKNILKETKDFILEKKKNISSLLLI